MFTLHSDKRILEKRLETFIGSTIFRRGKTYFNQGAVRSFSVAPDSSRKKVVISAKVKGSRLYTVHLSFHITSHQFTRPQCSCPYDWGNCKHVAAAGLAFLEAYDAFIGDQYLAFESPADFVDTFSDFIGTPTKASARTKKQRIREAIIEQDNASSDNTNSEQTQENSLKQLLRSIGIDANRIAPDVLEQLATAAQRLPARSRSRDADRRSAMPKNAAEHYHVVLSIDYSLEAKIYDNSRKSINWPVQPTDLLRHKRAHLTQAQTAWLEFMRDTHFWERSFDYGMFFSLLKDSDFPVFFRDRSEKNRLVFEATPEPLRAELFAAKQHYERHGETVTHTELILRLHGSFSQGSHTSSFCGPRHLTILSGRTIAIHPLSERLSKTVSRILETASFITYRARYYGGQPFDPTTHVWEAPIDEHSLIDINTFLRDAKQYFQLETTLPESFEIIRHEAAWPVLVVDYDSNKHTLQTRVLMDYEGLRVDVAHLMQPGISGGRKVIKPTPFANREKHHISVETENAVIRYALFKDKQERAVFKRLHNEERFGFTKRLKCVRKGSRQIAKYHQDHWPHIKTLGYSMEFVRDELNFADGNFQAKVSVDMDAENDWLAFDVDCYCGDDRVTLEDLKQYVKNKDEFIRLNNGRMLRIANWEELERFVLMLEGFYQKENGRFEGRAHHAPELENVFTSSPYYNAKMAAGFKQFIKEAKEGKPVEKVALPRTVAKTLRDYQKEGIHWLHFLRKYRFAGILADDMGLGKTLQALTLIHMNRVPGKPSLVVCPKTLLFNWEQETNKFFPDIKTLIVEGSPTERRERIKTLKRYDLVVTSYPAVKKDFELYEKSKVKFHYCLLDEAQSVKNHRTQNAQIVKKIPADYRLALTGTPLENSVSEIWSVFDFLMPGFLGNYASFVKRFQTPIMKGGDARALAELRQKVSCFMLRRTKEKVLSELPPKIFQTVTCELEEAQNVLYQEILANVKSDIFDTVKQKGFAKSQIHILAGLTKLRQACNHPALLLREKDFKKYESAKLKAFEELVDEIVSSGRKVLVFSQFTRMLDILEQVLAKKKIGHLYLSGKTKNRKELVTEFNESKKKKVFLISLKAGGTGLNLTSADNVIIFDPWWNPSVENQAIDRAHRMGQKNSVNVYRLVTKGTIEERILKLQEKKQFLFDNLVNESKDLFKHLTWDDIKELFR